MIENGIEFLGQWTDEQKQVIIKPLLPYLTTADSPLFNRWHVQRLDGGFGVSVWRDSWEYGTFGAPDAESVVGLLLEYYKGTV